MGVLTDRSEQCFVLSLIENQRRDSSLNFVSDCIGELVTVRKLRQIHGELLEPACASCETLLS